MSSGLPRPCIKPPVRNPWVCEETVESSNSSSTHSQDAKSRSNHGVLAAQYATPFQSSHPRHSSSHSQSTSGHSGHSGHSQPTESDTHPIISPLSAIHSGPVDLSNQPVVHYNPPLRGSSAILQQQQQILIQDHANHGLVHQHTHSLHSTINGTQSVYSMSGPHLHAPHPGHVMAAGWHDPKILWAASQSSECPHPPPGAGVYTVAAENPSAVLCPHSQLPACTPGVGVLGDLNTATGWCGATVVDTGRCYQCNLYCFRGAQCVFIMGIIAGFSLLVAGGVYQRHQYPHLQVLVYIGAMIALVCVVLLVIFCAVNRRPSYKRSISQRNALPHQNCPDPESVPLRTVSDPSGPIDPMLCPGVNPSDLVNSREFMQCIVRPADHSACSLTSTNQSACSLGSKSVQFNIGPYNNGVHNRKSNDCLMNAAAVVVSGAGYPLPPSSLPSESCLLNPVSHNLGANLVGGVHNQQGCLVAANNQHAHIAPMIASANPSSQIPQIRLQTNRSEETYAAMQQLHNYHTIWKEYKGINIINPETDPSSKL